MALPRFIIHGALLSVTLAAKCYYTDGSFALAEQQPCFPNQENSACCGIAKKNGDANDYCLTSGLCLGQVSGYTGLVLLNSCTDPTWESEDCPSICPKSMRGAYGLHILPCLEKSNSHWCCSADGSDCCNDAFKLELGTLMFPNNGSWTNPTSVVNPPTASPSLSTSTGTGTTSTNSGATTTVTVTNRPTSDSDSASASEAACDSATCPDNKTAVVGIGVGMGVGLIVCLISSAGALWFQRRVYKRRLEETQSKFSASYGPNARAHAEMYGHAQPPVAELPLNRPPNVFEM